MWKLGHITKKKSDRNLKEAISKLIFLHLIISGVGTYQKYKLFKKQMDQMYITEVCQQLLSTAMQI